MSEVVQRVEEKGQEEEEDRQTTDLPSAGNEEVGNTEVDSGSKVIMEKGASEAVRSGDAAVEFPLDHLARLDEQLGRPKWVVPVRRDDDLERLLRASIKLCREGRDTEVEACQRFFREGLTLSFSRILTDDAVSTWKPDIQRDIYNNTVLLVELCVAKLDKDWFVLLELLALVFNPQSRWHSYNANVPPETCDKDPEKLFAMPQEGRPHSHSKIFGWLLDMINLFGDLGGFQVLHDRIVNGENLTVPLIAALIRPFGYCAEFLLESVYQKYLIPIVDKVIGFLDGLSNDSLKKEATSEARSETFSSIMKSLRHLCRRMEGREDIESFRLKMILRLLQIASFNGKMNALNEINKIIPTVTYHPNFAPPDDDQMQAEKLANWVRENNVLEIVLRDNLHQPQYVEKLDKLVRFCIKEKVLSLQDLDRIWACQDGKHEIIVKNIHDLLVKLAWDFSPEQLDHLFGCFQRSWVGASKKQCEELLEFIRHLAEDDKEGVMAVKVLDLLWNLAHRDDCPPDTMDHALSAHIKILDYSCSQERESQKLHWLQRCVEDLSSEKWVISALKHMKEICLLYLESPVNYVHSHHRQNQFYYRNEIISHLDTNYHLLSHICQNLELYMRQARDASKEDDNCEPETLYVDQRFSHTQQLMARLDFVRFALKDGQLWLGHQQALMVWESLVENPAFASDRDTCFRWFAKLVSDEPDIEPDTVKKIFTEKLHRMPPQHLTENGFRCFDRFFRMVNINERRLSAWRRGFITENVDLVGLDYLWKAVLLAPDSIVYKPIELLKDVYTNLSNKLQQDQIHLDFIQTCMQRLQVAYDNLQQFQPGQIENEPADIQFGFNTEITKLVRCLSLLKEYLIECDEDYQDERGIPAHAKAAWGRAFLLVVRYSSHHQQPAEDFELASHSNETIAAVRRHILQRLKLSYQSRLELSVGNEVLRVTDDRRAVSAVPLRDRAVLNAKLLFSNVSETSMNSSDNSTDSSEGSPLNHMEGPNIEAEKMLPSVLIASEQKNIDFLLSLCDFAILRGFPQLRDSVRNLLKLLPTGTRMLGEMLDHCRDCSQRDSVSGFNSLRSYFVDPTPSSSRTLYLLEISHAMLMPSVDFRDSESVEFQVNFVVCGGLKLLLSFLTDKTLLADAGNVMKRSAMMTIMKMLKLLLMASAYGCIVHVVQDMKNKQVSDERHKAAMVLQTALQNIIPLNEQKLRHTASMLARQYWEKLISPLPDVSVVRSIQLLAWSAACGDVSLSSEPTSIHNAFTMLSSPPSSRGVDTEDMHLARDSLEVLSLSIAISPHVLTSLETSQDWKHFVIDTLLLIRNRLIRITAADQLFYMVTKCSASTSSFISFISLLFSGVESVAKDHAPTSGEFFRLLARLLNHAHQASVQIVGLDKLLEEELKWLLKVREDTLASPTRQCPVEGPLLDGHLSLLVELLTFRSVSERHHIGSKSGGEKLIEIVMSDFLFPASRLVKEARENPDSEKQELSEYVSQPICSTTECTQSAFKLLNALCAGCSENISTLNQLLSSYFYSGQDPPLCEWEFIPHIGPRPLKGFVGLKNAGATCYMNSVLQQLYTIPPIRVGILAVEEAAKEFVVLEEQEREGEKKERKQRERLNNIDDVEEESEGQALQSVPSSSSDNRKDTQRKVLMQLQSIFSHLLEGRLQFHTPQGFWREFRLWGERVNLREQHDAFEFFNCLVDNLDEGLKTFSYCPVLSEVLGGAFADQKICRGCPHRYSREESFTALNIDIRNQQHLFESLDAFVKGDLLEGANAYHCEKCDKKVDTVKRLCISRLPKVLVIQLKRFDYDWERETAVKFNDYFEFPRELDMSPYTAATLAKTEGEEIPSPEETEQKIPGDKPETPVSTHYHLRGIVVHSGQASGGHYYSFIRVRPQGSGSPKWFRFDDGEVVEAKIDDEEEFKAQCFGGDYTGEVYDHVLKKTHYRRQKRWWSAYLLFYDRADQYPVFDEALQSPRAIPKPMKSIVHKQNLEFLHHKSHYSFPYFQFMKNFLIINGNHIKAVLERNPHMTLEMEKLGLQCVQLATTFLFHCGIHTKKTLRGPAAEWYDALQPFLLLGPTVRLWFAENVFLKNRDRFSEYLLECPSAEVRNMFSKMITFLCVATNKDPPIEVSVTTNAGTEKTRHLFSEIALNSLLQLLKKQVADNSRHLNQYFQVFLNYANRGVPERKQLLHLSVPSLFIAVALDEGPGPPLRSPYADLSKLYAVVGILVRSCDVTMMQKSLYEGQEPLPNPFADPELSHPLPNDLHNWLYERINTQQNVTFTKKMIEDNSTMDETVQFLCFVCWEHWQFSMIVLNDLLLEIAAVQVFDMRPFLDLLSHLLMLQDTWQGHRISTALKGFTHHADGLITIIQHGQTHFHKRAYLCIKFLVALCGRCPLLYKVISEDLYIKTHWQSAIRWLHTEMERRPYVTPGYSYTGWSPPAQSNEASNGYYLERSNSAKLTLKRAKELFPMEEPPEEHVEEVIPPGGDPDAGMPAEEAEIHGIERHPVPHTQQPHSNTSTQCPPSDSVPDNDPPTEQHPQPILPSNEQGTTTVNHGCSLTDSVDRIHEETLVGNKSDTSLPDSVPDPA